MEEKHSKKGIIGSVAVDSETGMEHYQVTKKNSVHSDPVKPSTASAAPHGITPNYGNKSEGDAQNLAGVPAEFMNLFEHDPSEIIIMQATRHPIGAFSIFALGGFSALLIIVAYLFLVSDPQLLGSIGVRPASFGVIGGFIVLMLLAMIIGVSLIAVNIYNKSRLILTNQKVVLIQYHSLISREVSQLNISEVEDVNVSQPTLIDRIFKTGRITIETAGEQNNYVLQQVEKPYDFAHKTIQMHEGSIAEYGN